MDGSFFVKYAKVIKKKEDERDAVLGYIFAATGMVLTKEEVVVDNKKVSCIVSSAKKARLHQFRVRDILEEHGYTLTY